MRRAPSVATLGAAIVIYADMVYPRMTFGARISTAVAASVIPMIAWIAAFRRSR